MSFRRSFVLLAVFALTAAPRARAQLIQPRREQGPTFTVELARFAGFRMGNVFFQGELALGLGLRF